MQTECRWNGTIFISNRSKNYLHVRKLCISVSHLMCALPKSPPTLDFSSGAVVGGNETKDSIYCRYMTLSVGTVITGTAHIGFDSDLVFFH